MLEITGFPSQKDAKIVESLIIKTIAQIAVLKDWAGTRLSNLKKLVTVKVPLQKSVGCDPCGRPNLRKQHGEQKTAFKHNSSRATTRVAPNAIKLRKKCYICVVFTSKIKKNEDIQENYQRFT